VKVRTTTLFRDGTYDWSVYVPAITEPGATSSIGAFLYSPESTGDLAAREIDFEIGYGKKAEREAYAIPAGKLMCYMTLQRDDSVRLPIDMNPASIPYRTVSVDPTLPFAAYVEVNGSFLFPIETLVGLTVTPEAGAILRLDFSLGVDSDGDGLPDEWELAQLRSSGLVPGGQKLIREKSKKKC